MRIALVNPVTRRTQGYHTVGSYVPQLGLQVLAELVPAGHEVDIIDEVFGPEAAESMITRDRYDLVGVTGYTSGATRAYEIAAKCREEGIPVVMGGPHASACPDEAARYVDAVAVGECDTVWPQIIQDAANGALKPRYQGELADMSVSGMGRAAQGKQPINGKYTVSAIQTSRGCPVGCEYCSVTQFNGAPIRRRPIPEIIEEWNRTPEGFIFVVDDNFFGVGPEHAEWAKELLREIAKPGNKRRLWFSQTTLNMGDDPEGLKLAYKAGCRGMMVGFESLNRESLKKFHKGINRKNLARYPDLIDGFHKQGVSVFGGFIIGSDEDTAETVVDTAMMATRLGVDIIQVTNLTVLPGTKLYDRFIENKRVFALDYPKDWERYSFVETVYNPTRMTPEELDEAIYELRYGAAKTFWVWKRALRAFINTRSLTTALFVLGMNQGWKRMAKIQAPNDEKTFGFVPSKTSRMKRVLDCFKINWDKKKARKEWLDMLGAQEADTKPKKKRKTLAELGLKQEPNGTPLPVVGSAKAESTSA